MRRRLSALLLLWFLFSLTPLAAQGTRYYFYKPGQTRGTDAAFNPLTLLLNGSFDALRNGSDEHHNLSSFRWQTDFQNVWNNVTHPIRSIDAYGWREFRREEIINLSFNIDELQFLPNVADHTIAYGMLYAKVTEWYDAHAYPAPLVWGVGTSLVFMYVNEMVQNGGVYFTNVDCVADYDIFNILGFALFSFDAPKRFFTETVQLNEWSLQPLYVPRNMHLENVGQEFLLRYRLPWADRYAPFICWGVNSVVGLSYRYDRTNSLSFGVGQAMNGIKMVYRGEYKSASPILDPAAGFFWDDDGSLLASAVVTGIRRPNTQINIYPGLVSFLGVQPGLYLGAGEREGLIVGVTFMHLPVSLGIER